MLLGWGAPCAGVPPPPQQPWAVHVQGHPPPPRPGAHSNYPRGRGMRGGAKGRRGGASGRPPLCTLPPLVLSHPREDGPPPPPGNDKGWGTTRGGEGTPALGPSQGLMECTEGVPLFLTPPRPQADPRHEAFEFKKKKLVFPVVSKMCTAPTDGT